MIRRLYDGYVSRAAADRGAGAFFKWLLIGYVLQIAFLVITLPLAVAGGLWGGDAAGYAAAAAFVVAFLAMRTFLFALPCRAAAERKNLGSPRAWAAAGLVFGQFALATAAALAPLRTIEP